MKKSRARLFKSSHAIHVALLLLVFAPSAINAFQVTEKGGMAVFVLSFLAANSILVFLIYGNAFYWIPAFFNKAKYTTYFVILIVVVLLYVEASIYYAHQSARMHGFKETIDLFWESFYILMNTLRYLVISILLYLFKEKLDQEKVLEQIKSEKSMAELTLLKSQINPHFLFNTLNNLYGLALKKSDKSPELILKLSKIMDYIIHEASAPEVYLKHEIENVRNYVELEEIRQGNDSEISFLATGDTSSQKIAPLLFLPLVENAFKHGVNESITGFVDIKFTVTAYQVILTVRNSIPGVSINSKDDGLGLNNLRKRLEMIYPGGHSLEIKKGQGAYSAELKVDFQ